MRKKQVLELPPAARSAEEWALNEILSCGDYLNARLNEALKPFGVSLTQYSALRILSGEEEGLASGAIGDRMTTQDSDVTRLVDRLVKRGLVARERDARDRRVVKVRLTPAGENLVDQIDAPALGLIAGCFAGVKPKRVRRLIEVLRQVRGGAT